MTDEIITCTVTVSDVDKSNGEEVIGQSVTKEQDLFTNNFGKLMASWLRPIQASNIYAYESGFVGISGNTFDMYIYYVASGGNRWNYGNPGGTIVAVGTTSTTPARSDIDVAGRVGPWTKTLTSAQYVSSTAVVVFAGDVYMSSYYIAASGNPIVSCGAGFVLHNGAAVDQILMTMHDSFGTSGVDVQSGHYARVTYTIGV